MDAADKWLAKNAPQCSGKHLFPGKDKVVEKLHKGGKRNATIHMRIKTLYKVWRKLTKTEFVSLDDSQIVTLLCNWAGMEDVQYIEIVRGVALKKPPKAFYQSWEWKELRYKVLVKYGAVCMVCGATKETDRICVDHIKPRSKYPELALDEDNLQVLCNSCNMGKSNKHELDHRPKANK